MQKNYDCWLEIIPKEGILQPHPYPKLEDLSFCFGLLHARLYLYIFNNSYVSLNFIQDNGLTEV